VIGFLVNPYAGSGGRLGLKGSDGIRLLNPETWGKVRSFLERLKSRPMFLTPRGRMGEQYFRGLNFQFDVIGVGGEDSRPEDTVEAVQVMLNRGVKVVVFAGGDGTARLVSKVTGLNVPILGIPTGVKMHSGVFAETPRAAAVILEAFLDGKTRTEVREVVDVDEEEYRKGRYTLKFYGEALTLTYGNLVALSKAEIEGGNKEEIAKFVLEKMDVQTYYVLGPGSTVKEIERLLGIPYNALSVDVIRGGRRVVEGANSEQLLSLKGQIKVILTPIGGQGFLLGRGNQEISPELLRRIGKEGIIVLSTLEKLRSLECLRVDTGDEQVDSILSGYYRVIVGYEEYYVIGTCNNT